jgi:diguanylate cyclase (GGDEF)-like protein
VSDRGNEPVPVERAPRVLAVDDDEDIRRLVATYLELEGFDVSEARDGLEALQIATEERPDLILMDVMMPKMSGTEALAELRKDFRTAFTPVVLLTAKTLVADKVEHLLSGADDYVVKPFDPEELVARIRVVLRRSQALRGLNPITGLPGNTVIADELMSRLSDGNEFACLYVDLDNFKSYNDYYGFSRGDAVIKLLAKILLEVLEKRPSDVHFAGHIGGDDFVVVTSSEMAEPIAEDVCARFDAEIPDLYEPVDRERGWIEVEDRRGQLSKVPFVSVSVGIVQSAARDFQTAAEVAHVAAEMKGVAKRAAGSTWAVDRRRQP